MCRIVGLKPLVFGEPKVLILGSMPSEKSIEKQMYYANPTNRFWSVLQHITKLDTDNPEDLLSKSGVALWDICDTCIRKGSSDATIRDVIANDIPGFLKQYPSIERIVCNGKTSFANVKKFYPALAERVMVCPSTSAANARFRLDDLVKEYRKVICDE